MALSTLFFRTNKIMALFSIDVNRILCIVIGFLFFFKQLLDIDTMCETKKNIIVNYTTRVSRERF